MDAPHVTITILDVFLSLVHIPRSRLAELNRPIVKQLLRKRPQFLNLTANELELSIFIEDNAADEFEAVARKDRQRMRQRDLASGGSSARRRRHAGLSPLHPVEISFDKWRVLQIDSHEDSLSKSGSRVRDLSAPLAAAGISILYQSSYLSDFIFVKASRLGAVMELLGAAGFTFYNADPSIFHQINMNELGRLARLHMEANGYGISAPGSPGAMSPAVLSRTRSASIASLTALSYAALSRKATLEGSIASAELGQAEGHSSRSKTRSKKSMSPASAPVDVLSPDIACVGLNDSAVDVWTLKILTLVGYPELIPIPSGSGSAPDSDFAYDSRMHSLYDPVPSDPRIRNASPDAVRMSSVAAYDSTLEDLVPSKQFPGRSVRPPSYPEESSSTSLSSCSSSDDEDEYFSSPSPYTKRHDASDSSVPSRLSNGSASSLPDRLGSYLASGRAPLPRPSGTTATDAPPSADASLTEQQSLHPPSGRLGSKPDKKKEALRVPFFSFTRTAEGSSLTTDLRVLAALFSPDERHMVICASALLETGDALNEGALAPHANDGRAIFDLGNEADLFVMEDEDACAPGLMKCLQIDLHRYGLEKHGLANRFSGVLDENGINHMYSSTYKTANLLVDKENALRAQHLLRTC